MTTVVAAPPTPEDVSKQLLAMASSRLLTPAAKATLVTAAEMINAHAGRAPAEVYQHRKSGNYYTILARDVRISTDEPLIEGDKIIVYVASDETVHGRSVSEFNARFDLLPAF